MKICEPIAKRIGKTLVGNDVEISKKTYGEIWEIFKNPDRDIDSSTIMYEVCKVSSKDSDLQHAITTINPILVSGECNMTRGHFHKDETESEIYIGAGGEGLLLLCDKKGNTWTEKIFAGSVHIIPGNVGHRCINTSDEEKLYVECYWSKKAGYDYEYMEKHPFEFRVIRDNG